VFLFWLDHTRPRKPRSTGFMLKMRGQRSRIPPFAKARRMGHPQFLSALSDRILVIPMPSEGLSSCRTIPDQSKQIRAWQFPEHLELTLIYASR
jgi:hypothetical protein